MCHIGAKYSSLVFVNGFLHLYVWELVFICLFIHLVLTSCGMAYILCLTKVEQNLFFSFILAHNFFDGMSDTGQNLIFTDKKLS
jgi:hypothetical protein